MTGFKDKVVLITGGQQGTGPFHGVGICAGGSPYCNRQPQT